MKKISTSLLAILLFTACKKTELPAEPVEELATATKKGGGSTLTVTTQSVSVASISMASASGSISSGGGGSSVVERGFCYSTSTNPTIANDTARAGSGAGNFQRGITGLATGTTYYIKAYAIKNTGSIHYGNELSFTTFTLGMPGPGIGTVTDIDGNVYNTVTLGTQVWMVENLKTTRYRDGTSIDNLADAQEWNTTTSGAYCDYNNDPANAIDNGRLYNLYAVKDSRNLAPTGWHIPNFSEWQTLMNYLGGAGIAGGRLKEAGLAHWDSPNTGADNSSWFTALGSGHRSYGSTAPFFNMKRIAIFWTSSSSYSSNPNSFPFINSIILDYNSASWSYQAGSIGGGTRYGYAVRCVKD